MALACWEATASGVPHPRNDQWLSGPAQRSRVARNASSALPSDPGIRPCTGRRGGATALRSISNCPRPLTIVCVVLRDVVDDVATPEETAEATRQKLAGAARGGAGSVEAGRAPGRAAFRGVPRTQRPVDGASSAAQQGAARRAKVFRGSGPASRQARASTAARNWRAGPQGPSRTCRQSSST